MINKKVNTQNNVLGYPRFVENIGIYMNPDMSSTGIAKIICVGDLTGEPTLQKAQFKNGRFDFRPCFEYVKPILEEADLVLGNLETTICTKRPDGKTRAI